MISGIRKILELVYMKTPKEKGSIVINPTIEQDKLPYLSLIFIFFKNVYPSQIKCQKRLFVVKLHEIGTFLTLTYFLF